ncbi:MAG TPA: BON domain-containing protein [Pseudonocardiaceae bacterium]|nr:BON domain-containing protein [Pseudonocardiaceae bacterium]
MTNEALERNVIDELAWDPKIDSGGIAVYADGGSVTLRGTVGSFRQKREAKRAAERVHGVTKVNNGLEVRVLTEHRREDAELRGDVLQALMLDTLVPTTIDATVTDGIVTLTGTAEWRYQRDEAEFIAANVLGVIDVENDVDVMSPIPDAGEVHHSIKRALERAAKLDADNIAVNSSQGSVTLTGSVRSWSERDAAVAAAWSAPGVVNVDDRLTVYY